VGRRKLRLSDKRRRLDSERDCVVDQASEHPFHAGRIEIADHIVVDGPRGGSWPSTPPLLPCFAPYSSSLALRCASRKSSRSTNAPSRSWQRHRSTKASRVDPPRLVADRALTRYQSDSPLVLDDVALRIEPGEFVAIVGPSGCTSFGLGGLTHSVGIHTMLV
jgi:ABC-type multidrug transport system fused ATPase/permease subunit